MIKVYWDGKQLEYESSIFPGGEVHVRFPALPLDFRNISIHALVKNSDDIFRLLLITDALKRRGAKNISLSIPYLPYARQDRVCNSGESLSVKVMCDLINLQGYSEVIVSDVHSDVALALLNNVVNLEIPIRAELRKSILVSPDAGSVKRVSRIADERQTSFARADKKRSDDSWEVTIYSEHIGDKDFFIIDDICDGGRTFIELAKKLRPLTNGDINLYVTHGIFSNGMSVFDGLIDKIYCAYPWILEDVFEEEGFFDVNKRIVK